MQTYRVKLSCAPSNHFLAIKAAQSCDLNLDEKLTHELIIDADLQNKFSIGLIYGASGSGKTTLARQIFGDTCFDNQLDSESPIIQQFPNEMTYDQIAELLGSMGLSSVPCWIKPLKTLSNGQQSRAMAAWLAAQNRNICAIDEWTSVVDRTIAKVMSHTLNKFARKNGKSFVLCSCHYDVLEWLDPNWVIDCNTQKFIDRRLLQRDRKEKLLFEVRETNRNTWKQFSKYHYLSSNLPGGLNYFFGIFHNQRQIGFQCFSNYVPTVAGKPTILHSNRTVIHPDYCGFGLGVKLINLTSRLMQDRGFRIMAKFSSIPIAKSLLKSNFWKLKRIDYMTSKPTGNMLRQSGFRNKIKYYCFELKNCD